MHKLVLFFVGCVMLILAGCRTGTVVFQDELERQAVRTADTIRDICKYPSYEHTAAGVEAYRTIIASLLIHRRGVSQSEDYRAKLVKVLTDTGISVEFADRITKVIVYGYMEVGNDVDFAYYLNRLLFHLDQRQVFYDPYSDVVFTSKDAESRTN